MILLILLTIYASFTEASLADDLEVHSYELSYKVDLDNFEIFGNVSIIFRSKKNLNSFFIHSNGLDIYDISLTIDGELPCPFTNSSENDRIIVNTTISLKPTYMIHALLRFHGTIEEQLEGMYRSLYYSPNSPRWLVSTHFEPIFARKAFPCFDQPLIRAIFKVDFTVKDKFNVIFNTPLENSVELGDGWKRLTFKPTPAMPTYTLGWAIHDNSYTAITKDVIGANLSYGVFSAAAFSNQTSYALASLEKLVPAYNEYTGIDYSSRMSKLDLLVIPELYFGAMENWGIITFQEHLIFDNQNFSNSLDLQNIFMVITHELAHQWFGNLVTLQWWSYTWLNEGFAQYLEYLISSKIQPDWKLEDQFVVEELQKALELDTDGSRPLTKANLTTDVAITRMFDFVSYKKGASILRMVAYIAREENFRTGLNIYLQNVIRLGGVSTPDYLWSALSLVVPPVRLPLGITLAELMKSWTETSSYPLVHVERQGNVLKLHQTIFERNMKMVGHWWIPIFYNTDKNAISYNVTWLQPRSELSIEVDPDIKWYFINLNEIGYYRVNYDDQNWKALANVLIKNPSTFTIITRCQMINDVIALMRAGHVKSEIAFEVLQFLDLETEYLPWKTALDSFQVIMEDFKFSTNLKDWKAYVNAKLDKVLNKVMMDEPGDHLKNLQKLNMMSYACKFEHPYCIQRINETSDREVKEALDCAYMKNASQVYFDSVLNTYIESIQPIQKLKLLKTLACTNNGTLQRKLLDLTYTRYIKKQDSTRVVLKTISSSPLGAKTTMQFLNEKYDHLNDHFGGDMLWKNSLLEIVNLVAQNMETESEIVQIGNFLKMHQYPNSDTSEFISMHKINLKRRKSVEYEICKWVKCSTAVTGGTTLTMPILAVFICSLLVLTLL